jgi:hypothetical protein
MSEATRHAKQLEFYLPGGRRLTLIKRDTWLALFREVFSVSRTR